MGPPPPLPPQTKHQKHTPHKPTTQDLASLCWGLTEMDAALPTPPKPSSTAATAPAAASSGIVLAEEERRRAEAEAERQALLAARKVTAPAVAAPAFWKAAIEAGIHFSERSKRKGGVGGWAGVQSELIGVTRLWCGVVWH